MKINIRKLDIGELLFYSYWLILMVGKGLGYTAETPIFQIMCWIAVILAFLKLIVQRYNTKEELLVCIILNVLGLTVWYFSGSTTVLLSMITITAMKDINFDEVLKISFWVRMPLFVVRTSLAIIGVIDSQMKYFYSSGEATRLRYALGYDQPNATHFNLFIIAVLFILIYKNRIRFWQYAMILVYNYFIFSYTNSRTGFLMVTLLVIVSWLANSIFSGTIYSCLRFLANKIFAATTILSFTIALLFWQVDLLRSFGTFSSRFSTAVNIISSNNINLFGTSGITTDFGMIAFLYGDGLIYMLFFLAGYYRLLKHTDKGKNIYFMIVCCCYAVYCLSEAYVDSILMNVTLLAFADLIYEQNNDIKYIDDDAY